jgi:hypothetical protein
MEALSQVRRYPYGSVVTHNHLILVAVAFFGLLLRLHSLNYITESLWNEDGYLINQSYDLGIKSVWTPFSYLFVYHRLVALLARLLPLVLTPYIFFIAWAFAYFLTIWVIKTRSQSTALDPLSALLLTLAITFQPSHGEAWFNLNQTHCTLGIALCLYVCIPARKPASPAESLFLLVASLSGVNSIVLTVILACQLVVLSDFHTRKATYILVPAGALVEGAFLFASHRVQQTGIDSSPMDWLHAISIFLTFAATSAGLRIIAVLFWLITFFYFWRWILQKKSQPDRAVWLSPLLAAGTAVLMLLAAAVSEGKWLRGLSPMDIDSRYFLIPYSLFFFVAFICTKDKRPVQITLACLAGIICATEFVTVDRADRASSTGILAHANMQWIAFSRFQKIRPDLIIPINSPYPIYPPDPYVQIAKGEPNGSIGNAAEAAPIILIPLRATDLRAVLRSDKTLSVPSVVSFDIKKYCAVTRYIALEVDIWRERMGSAKVYWKSGRNMVSEKSLERFYPAGFVTMQFAFRKDATDSHIDFYPALGVGDSAVVRKLAQWQQDLREMGQPLDSKTTVAQPTPAGGEVRLKEVRLFCLK